MWNCSIRRSGNTELDEALTKSSAVFAWSSLNLSSPLKGRLFFFYSLFIYGVGIPQMPQSLCRSPRTTGGNRVCPRDGTQVVRPRGKCLYPLSHLAGSPPRVFKSCLVAKFTWVAYSLPNSGCSVSSFQNGFSFVLDSGNK